MNASSFENVATAEKCCESNRKFCAVRLTLDARIWQTGIGTYTLNLLRAMRRVGAELWIRVIVGAEAAELVSGLCDETCLVESPIYSLREQFRIPGAVGECNLLHVPHYNVPVLYRGPLVVTIHDLTHLTDPAFRKTVKARLYARPMLKMAARKASHLITDSEYSRGQILQHLNVESGKVSAIHLGVGPQFKPTDRQNAARSVKAKLQLNEPYLLFVGNLKPHKNLKTLLRAFALLLSRKRVERTLVLVGDDKKGRYTVQGECRSLGISDAVRHIPWAEEEMMPQLYTAADLLVMPSTSEGFGLPVLEAMACRTPVACSNAASLPEVGGDAVVYFDPYSVEDMADAIERIIDSPGLQAEMTEKGLKQAAKFTWEECARKHLEVYRRVVCS